MIPRKLVTLPEHQIIGLWDCSIPLERIFREGERVVIYEPFFLFSPNKMAYRKAAERVIEKVSVEQYDDGNVTFNFGLRDL